MKHRALIAAVITLTCAGCSKTHRIKIENKGSDTMSDVAQAWAHDYGSVKPDVFVSVSGGGTGTGVAALIDGKCDIANCSRQFEPKEIADAKAKGHEPVEFPVGHDAIAIYVHKDNPIASITIEQLADVFGENGKVTKWSELGVKVAEPKDDPIIVVCRQNNSGTYAYFKEVVLNKGRFRLGTLDQPGSKDVVECVATHVAGIGYSGIAFARPTVRMVPVIKRGGGPAVTPSIDTALDGSYPIARMIYMYTVGQPQGEVKAYLDWILSDAGQRVLLREGYPPLRKL